jgi:DNA-binding NarL/FixJ family response regulator
MTILIADDHRIFREGLNSLLKEQLNEPVILEAERGADAVQTVAEHPVDLVLLDIEMPDISGVEAAKAIKQLPGRPAVISLTMYNQYEYVTSLYEAGVDGYVLKDCSFKELLKAITTVLAGDQYFCEAVKPTLFTYLLTKDESRTTVVKEEVHMLTEREKEILILICNQYSTQAIADRLFISPLTVNNHRRNIMSKTGARNVAGLVLYALRHQLIQLGTT